MESPAKTTKTYIGKNIVVLLAILHGKKTFIAPNNQENGMSFNLCPNFFHIQEWRNEIVITGYTNTARQFHIKGPLFKVRDVVGSLLKYVLRNG